MKPELQTADYRISLVEGGRRHLFDIRLSVHGWPESDLDGYALAGAKEAGFTAALIKEKNIRTDWNASSVEALFLDAINSFANQTSFHFMNGTKARFSMPAKASPSHRIRAGSMDGEMIAEFDGERIRTNNNPMANHASIDGVVKAADRDFPASLFAILAAAHERGLSPKDGNGAFLELTTLLLIGDPDGHGGLAQAFWELTNRSKHLGITKHVIVDRSLDWGPRARFLKDVLGATAISDAHAFLDARTGREAGFNAALGSIGGTASAHERLIALELKEELSEVTAAMKASSLAAPPKVRDAARILVAQD